MRLPRTTSALLVVLALGTAAACGGSEAAPVAAPTSAAPSPAAPEPSPEPPPPPAPTDPLTGRPGTPAGPVVVVKVDNETLALPFQRGLEQASVVYQELIEGGSTRLAAVYTDAPDLEVGPVRSVRESDLELLAPYGPVVLAYSGANSGVLAAIREADVVDGSYAAAARAYRLGQQRRDARNFFVRPSAVAGLTSGGADPRDVGFRFGPSTTPGTPTAGADVPFSRGWRAGVGWDAPAGVYRISQNGRGMPGSVAANVVIQTVSVSAGRYTDVTGARTPAISTVGTGPVTVLRDGERREGTWSRPGAGDVTTFTAADGSPLTLAPGPTWVMLQPVGFTPTYR